MKTLRTLLAIAALLLLLPAGRAASPTYNSFDTNQFYTNGAAPILIHLNTNFPALVITNIYASNIYVTNIYASNIVSGDIIWTNAGPYITPLPFTNTFQITTEGAVLSGKSVWPWWFPDADDAFISVSDIVQGETGVRKLYLAGVDDAASPTNYSSTRLQVSGGAQPAGQFNLASTLAGVTSRLTINVQPDANVANIQLYNNGVLNFGVNDVSGYSGTGTNFLSDDGTYKQGVGTTINPTDQFIPYRFDGATFLDSPLYRIDSLTIGVDTIDANMIAATNLQSGGVVYSRFDGVLTNTVNGEGFLHSADASGTNLTWQAAGDICLWTNRAGLLQPVDATLPVGWTNQLRLGPSFANVLYGTNIYLVYTNPAAYSGYEIASGDGSVSRFLAGGNLAVIQGTSGVDLNDSLSAPNALRWASNHLLTLATNSVFGGGQFAAGSSPIGVVNLQTNLIWGFMNSIDTNYSRGASYHTGTNGAWVFDSQSSGTAGDPVAMNFNFGSTNRYVFGSNGVFVIGLTNSNVKLSSPFANGLQMGTNSATPSDQFLQPPNGEGTDKNGGTIYILGGKPTGTGIPGRIVGQLSKSSEVSSSTAPNYNAAFGLGGTISRNITSISNSLTTEITLMNSGSAAAQLTRASDALKVTAAGTFTANSNNKQIKLMLGSTVLFDTGVLAFNAGSWVISAEIIRASNTSQIVNVVWASSNSLLPISTSATTATETLSSLPVLAVKALCPSAVGDVYEASLSIELMQSNP